MAPKASSHPVTLIPGDGIGPEVVAAVQQVLAAAEVPVAWEERHAGATVFKKGVASGVLPETVDSIRRTKCALKGPLETPVGYGEKSANVTLRKYFETYGNIRPVRELPGIRTPYSGRGIDFVVVRENVEDLYAGIEYLQTPGVAQALKIVTQKGSEKICRLAFELARAEGRKKVTCATKANILKLTEGLFKRVFEQVAKDYPEIVADHQIVDNCAHQMVMRPEQFDVVVMTNMNGDILSDLASALIGGLGFAPSANLGQDAAIFEAVHGSAPQIAGKDMANPTAILSSAVLMLRHLGELKAAAVVENALLVTMEEGKVLTADMAGGGREPAGTKAYTAEVIKNLGSAPKSYPRREFKRLKMPTVTQAPVMVRAADRRPMGVDVFVETDASPGVLGPRIEAAIRGLPVKLAQISNRGAKVYPNDLGVEADPVDCARLRFVVTRESDALTDAVVLDLLQRVSSHAIWVHIEKLNKFDGQPAFTKDAGED
ncbi:MAG: NADP-dependent isocitrate dehydrogenase [Elusimicrobiota bacterium]|nr:NADP-dependent isocitrate dehydrogenase [Elusimicrobiota bacterium]